MLFRLDKSRSWLANLFIVSFAWFVIEVIGYGFLLFQVWNFGNVILVGNQLILDMLLKERVKYGFQWCRTNPGWSLGLDPDLGYNLLPGKLYAGAPATNDQGIRSLRNYDMAPDADVFRVAVFGDSFVFCDGEKTADCWTTVVEHSAANLEIMNFGVSGYGLSQSILRYSKEGVRFHPDLIVFNYIIPTPRDRIDWDQAFSGVPLYNLFLTRALFHLKHGKLCKEVSSPMDWFDPAFRDRALYRPAGIDLTKEFWASPVFSISNVLLAVKSRLAGEQYKKKILRNSTEEDSAINFALIKSLIDTARANGSMVLFYYDKPISVVANPVRKLLQANEDMVVYFDYSGHLGNMYLKHGVKSPKALINTTGHFNAPGNRIFGETFLNLLASREWGTGKRVFSFNPSARRFALCNK